MKPYLEKLCLSGHETFPLKYGWPKKAYDVLKENDNDISVFHRNDSIALFGVGKNMVAAIKFWSKHILLISDDSNEHLKNHLLEWNEILSSDGLDPWSEKPATLWYMHWILIYYGNLTTYSWFFNSFNKYEFNKTTIFQDLSETIYNDTESKVSKSTVKRDIDCFLRNYMSKPSKNNAELLESVLSELDLIHVNENNDSLRINRGKHTSLPIEIFIYALLVFWKECFRSNTTLSIQTVLSDYNSPGRIFCLSEAALYDYLDLISNYMNDISISETAGMKQLVLTNVNLFENNEEFDSKVIEILRQAWGQ